jgi:AraC-like DNA-binding protein
MTASISLHWTGAAVVLCIGIAEALLLAAALWSHPHKPNRSLSIFLLTLALGVLVPLLQELNAWQLAPRVVVLLSGTPFLMGPLLLLYVAQQTGYTRWIKSRWWVWHSLLPLAYLALALRLAFLADDDLLQIMQPITPRGGIAIIPLLKAVSLLLYLMLSAYLLRRYEKQLYQRVADISPVSLSWLRRLVWAAVVFYLSVLGIHFGVVETASVDGLMALLLSVLVLAFGIYALRQPGIFAPLQIDLLSENASTSVNLESDDNTTAPKTTLTPDAIARLQALLLQLNDNETLLFEHDLSLGRLAKALGSSTHQLSYVLNHTLHTSFYEHINGLRVRAVQQRLLDPQYRDTPILDLALTCGFSNKTTFNKAFKTVTGQTPRQWRNERR